MNLAAYSRQRRRFSMGSMARRTSTLAVSEAELHVHLVLDGQSRGSPHPGTYGELCPSMLRDLTTKSLSTLLSRVPM